MMTKEEYKKTYIRMMDSVRATHKGRANCEGVGYSICPLTSVCRCRQGMLTSNAFECIELVEKWGKEHPIETNGSRFLKNYPKAVVYKCDSNDDGFVYLGLDCSKPFVVDKNSTKFPIRWWESEVDNDD